MKEIKTQAKLFLTWIALLENYLIENFIDNSNCI